MTYVINQNYQDKFFVSPFDTGAYSAYQKAIVLSETLPFAAGGYVWKYQSISGHPDCSPQSPSKCAKIPMGNFTDFYHLIQPHLQVYGNKADPRIKYKNYGLDTMFGRWYGGDPLISTCGGPPWCDLPFFYFEIGWCVSALANVMLCALTSLLRCL
jgi:hypothetical protein